VQWRTLCFQCHHPAPVSNAGRIGSHESELGRRCSATGSQASDTYAAEPVKAVESQIAQPRIPAQGARGDRSAQVSAGPRPGREPLVVHRADSVLASPQRRPPWELRGLTRAQWAHRKEFDAERAKWNAEVEARRQGEKLRQSRLDRAFPRYRIVGGGLPGLGRRR
jgi:hypothetical protein